MKNLTVNALVAAVVMSASWTTNANAGQVSLKMFTAGTPALASEVNANFSDVQAAIMDNDTRLTQVEVRSIDNMGKIDLLTPAVNANTSAIAILQSESAANTTDIAALQAQIANDPAVVSSVSYRIPVLNKSAGNTTVDLWLVNTSNTTCNAWLASSHSPWTVGANAKGLLPALVHSAVNLPGVTSSMLNTTTTIVAQANMAADVSANDFVDVSLLRSEANASDTCNAGDVHVRGALVTYPSGLKHYVPVKDMTVE